MAHHHSPLELISRRVSLIWPIVLACSTLVSSGLAVGQYVAVRRTEGKLDLVLSTVEKDSQRIAQLEFAVLVWKGVPNDVQAIHH